jgi:ribonucleoside-triphosphate reductase
MKDFLDNTMLPVYDAGFVYMEKQYSTIGIMGIVEAAEYLGITPGNNKTYVDWVASQLKIIYDANREATKMFGVPFNTEMVPGESLGVKFASWDRADGYVVNRDCYNSYFYKVEDPNTDVFDKFQLHGEEIVKYLDGGSALHLNLDRSLTPDQYYNLMCLAAKVGCNYWTINVKATCCEDCGAIDKETTDVCSKCGSTNVVYATRVIGYLKKVSCFAEDRQREHAKRVYHRENR